MGASLISKDPSWKMSCVGCGKHKLRLEWKNSQVSTNFKSSWFCRWAKSVSKSIVFKINEKSSNDFCWKIYRISHWIKRRIERIFSWKLFRRTETEKSTKPHILTTPQEISKEKDVVKKDKLEVIKSYLSSMWKKTEVVLSIVAEGE